MTTGLKKTIFCLTALLCAPLIVMGQDVGDSRKAPEVIRCVPDMASVGTVLDLQGYRLGAIGNYADRTKIHFVQGNVRRLATRVGSQGFTNDAQNGFQHLDVNVPEGLALGPCQVTVEVDGQQSAPLEIEITTWRPPEITSISPPWAQPGQHILLEGSGFHVSDDIMLIDAQGRRHQFEPGHAASYSGETLPADLAEGEATLWIVNRHNPDDQQSRSITLQVSCGPIPLEIWPDLLMPVAPGQWLNLVVTTFKPLEGAERAEVAFQQNSQIISPIVDYESPRVEVPRNLSPGKVSLMTRTWRNGKSSPWSPAVSYQLLAQPAAPQIELIEIGIPDNASFIFLYEGPDRPQNFTIEPGKTMVWRGKFPVASVERMRVIIEGYGTAWTITPVAGSNSGQMKIELPQDIPQGDWQLIVRDLDYGTSNKLPITMRIE